jgi:hypothetical protein
VLVVVLVHVQDNQNWARGSPKATAS